VKTATKPPQPIEKSTAGASLLAQVIVTKWADHQPLHRQEKMFERHGINISRKTMGGWMARCAELLDPLYQLMNKEVLSSKVIGTDDTSVKVLDRKLPFARTGRIWPYVGDAHHPVIVYDYTPTRSRAGPAKFLKDRRPGDPRPIVLKSFNPDYPEIVINENGESQDQRYAVVGEFVQLLKEPLDCVKHEFEPFED
jgi:hypothetical protein